MVRILLFVALLLAPAVAAQQSPLVLARFEGPLVFDGMPDEPGWDAVEPLPVVQYEPYAGEPPTEHTEIRFAYDDRYLYASMRAYDRDPSGIRANTLYRDRLSGDDMFEFVLDTFNDNENAVIFTTTPAGVRRESAITNDASGGSLREGGWLNVNYNTFWDVQTVVTGEGWFVEVRIPFSSLRFRDRDGRVEMGLTVQRKIARRSERLVFPAVHPDVDFAFLKPSRARTVVLEGIYSDTPLYVTPYLLGGLGRSNHWDPAAATWQPLDDRHREIGADAKVSLTNDLTLDLTVNTDFAQVEADDQQVNLTRFSLFFPEKRQFFQERAGLFEFRTGGQSRLFHSRRIGLTEGGQPVRILGGARLVGRVGRWDVGALSMQTDGAAALPSENFGVLRMRRKVVNDFSYLGLMTTSRLGTGTRADGRYNVAYGLDGLFRVAGDDYLSFQWAQTFDEAAPGAGGWRPLDVARLTLAAERRRRSGFGYDGYLIRSGAHYEPGVGFVQRRDFTQADNTVSYTWMPGEASALIWHRLAFRSAAFLRNADHSLESAVLRPSWSFSTRTLSSGEVALELQVEDLLHPFVLSPRAAVPAGRYHFLSVTADYNMPSTSLRQVDVQASAGTFYDGWRTSVAFGPTWYVSKHLELSGQYQYDRVRLPERDQRFDAHIARLRVGTALDTKLSTNAFLQYNSAVAAFSANVRFRYALREGNDFWLVYNDGMNTDLTRYLDRPALPRLESRTIMLKYTHTFVL